MRSVEKNTLTFSTYTLAKSQKSLSKPFALTPLIRVLMLERLLSFGIVLFMQRFSKHVMELKSV